MQNEIDQQNSSKTNAEVVKEKQDIVMKDESAATTTAPTPAKLVETSNTIAVQHEAPANARRPSSSKKDESESESSEEEDESEEEKEPAA